MNRLDNPIDLHTSTRAATADQSACRTGIGVLSLWRAAEIHAERFGRPRWHSAALLASADWTITDEAAGVLAGTDLRRPIASAAIAIVAYGLSLATMLNGISESAWLPGITGFVSLTVAIAVVAPNAARRVTASRTSGTGRSILISDVATRPHCGAGDRLIKAATERADITQRPLVLFVRPDNHVARRLYERHGFHRLPTTGDTEMLVRQPSSCEAEASERQPD